VRISAQPPADSPAYAAGLDAGDVIRQVDGARVATVDDVNSAIARHKPGDRLQVEYVDRTAVPKRIVVTLDEDQRLELLPIESTGGTLTPAQRAFRTAWLGAAN
jgi:S1-C subfamily serine protease